MAGRLGSLAPMGGGGRADGRDAFGFSLDEDEKKAAARSTRSSSSSLSSLAPLGSGSLKPPSSGLGSLTSLSGASRPSAAAAAPSSFDLDDGFDALLSADTKPAASSSASSTAAKKPSKEKRSYDSGSDDEDSAARKKDKKKKSKKKDDAPLPSEKEDKSRRALPTRKMPAARPSTAPSEFDDDSLFGIKKEPSVTTSQANPRRSSMSKSQSIREHGNWDEEGEEDDAEGDAAGGAERHEYSTTKSAESTARKVTAAMAAKEKRDQEAYEKQQQPPPQSFLPEPLAVPLKEDPAPAPRTFGRPRATSGAAAPSSTAAAPAASTSAAPAPNSTPSPQASFLPTAAPPTTFHMPGGDDEPVVEEKKPIITAAKPATASSTSSIAHPPATAASSSSHFDDSDALPLEEGPPAVSPSLHPSSSSPAQAAPMSPDRGSADPFGGLEGDPMDEIDEKQGNLFSGFGAARPATTTAPLGRARRAIPSNTKPNAAAAAGGGQSRIHTAPAGGSTASASSSSLRHPPPASSSSLSTALIASGPSGPCVPGNLGTWMEWLGVDRRRKEDDKLMPIVQAASQAKTPAGWSLVNGWWINSKTGQQHKRHPYVKHFLSKIESKRLALKFSIEEDDDEDNDESLVASGDESTMPPGTPSSMHNRSGLFDESFNPLSPGPMSPKTRKIEATSHPAGQPPLMPVKMTGQQQQQPGSLSINTASASTVGAPPTHANMTPSPYYPGAPSAGFTPTASAPGSGLDSTTSSGLPSRGTTLQKLESVPERNAHAGGASSGGSVEALMGQATREKQARLAESERQMQERLAAAAAASSSTPYSTGVSGDSDRIISDLQNQVRLQSITIEELEKRKRALVYELENADVHLAQLLSEQRSRYEGQLIDQERRLRLEFDARRIDWQRTELSQQSQLAELEERLKGFEQRKTAAVTQAVHDAETKAREAMEHAVRLAQQNAESQRVHFERELESARLLHQQELQSLKQQHHDSTFLRSLVTQVENSAANVEGLAKKVYAERNASERMTFEQLTVRDGLLKEKELSLEQERRQNAELVQTYQKLTREHEEEKIRLREEHLRLQTLQHDIKSESAILQEQLSSERDQLRKERAALQQHREVWEIRQKREAAELELKKEMNERQHVQALESVEEAQRERAEILKQLDDEREEIRLEKSVQKRRISALRRTLNARRIALDSRESTLRNDEAEFAQHVQYFEQRLGELHLLGAKVQKQSAEVAEQYAKIAHERALIEAARAEARQFIELGEKAKADQANLSEQFRAERQSHEKERAELQAEKTKILLQKEIARKHLQMSKVLAGVQSGLGAGHYPPSAGLEASPLAYSKTDSFHPTASPSGMYSTRVMHSSPAHDLHGLGSGFTGFSPSPSSAATFGAHEYDFYPTAESPVHYPPASHHGDMSAALEALSSHAENLKGFLAEEKIMVQESP